MKTLMPPYTDLSLDFSYLTSPFEASKFQSVFEKYFTEVSVNKTQLIDIQFTMCDGFVVKAINMKNLNPLDKITLPSTNAALLVASNLFYFLLDLGNNHILGSSIASFLKSDSETFAKIGGGRFTNILSKNIVSLEEDELGRYYLLISNRPDLLSVDELFNFSRQILNS